MTRLQYGEKFYFLSGERANFTKRPDAIIIPEIIRMFLTFSVVPARGSSVGGGGSSVGVASSVGDGSTDVDGVGTQVTVTSSQTGPKVSWALTLDK